MPCLIAIVVLAFPRVTLACIFIFSSYLERAYNSLIVPLLGFFFLPLTTIVYAWLVNTNTPIAGVYVFLLIVAVILDLGGLGGGHYSRRNR
jgi:hypothetical protein